MSEAEIWDGEDPQVRLARLAEEGLRRRYPAGVPERHRVQAARELALIDRKGRCRGALGMTVPMPAYKSGEHMVEAVLPLLQETAQQLRPVL